MGVSGAKHRLAASVLALTVANLLAGTVAPGTAVMLREVPPLTLATLRNCLAAILYLLLLAITRTPLAICRIDIPKLLLAGCLGFGAAHVFVALGLTLTTVVSTSLLAGLTPVMVAILAMLHLHERIRARLVIGILLAFAGVAVLAGITSGSLLRLHAQPSVAGDLLVIVAVVFNALSVVLAKDLLRRNRPVVLNACCFLIGGVSLLPLCIYELSSGAHILLSLQTIAILGYVTIFVSVLSYLVWIWALRLTPASTAGVFHFVGPIAGALLGTIFLGEKLTLGSLVGGGLIFGGLGLSTWGLGTCSSSAQIKPSGGGHHG